MDDSARFQRLAAFSSILAAIVAVASAALSVTAVTGNTQAYIDYSLAAFSPGGAEVFRWAMVLDTFGFYLLLAPLALHLWDRLRPAAPGLARLYTLCGLGYIVIGAIGAMVLAAVVPRLITEYAPAAAARRETLEIVFRAFYDAVDRGLWNPLEMVLAAAGRVLGLEAVYQLGVGGIFILVPAWAVWSGVDLLRRPRTT